MKQCRLRSVLVREAVVAREVRHEQSLPGPLQNIRILCEGNDSSSDVSGGFGRIVAEACIAKS